MVQRPRVPRIKKPLLQKLSELDDHLYLLRGHLSRLNEGFAHFRGLSAELRVLACLSSRTEGLLWRLADELNVSDDVYLQVPGSVDTGHPLARGLQFLLAPIHRPGRGDPRIPAKHYPLRRLLKEVEALFVAGNSLTHEYLIKAIAQQMGSAHEDDELEPALANLGHVFVNGVQPFVPVLAMDSELVLEVGERVLEEAEVRVGFARAERPEDYGDLSVVVRLALRTVIAGRVPILKMRSYVADVEIGCSARPMSLGFQLTKRGNVIGEIVAPYPENWQLSVDALFVLSYCSRSREAHTTTNGEPNDQGVPCDAGWLHASEIALEELPTSSEGLVSRQFAGTWGRFLSREECLELLQLGPQEMGPRRSRQ